MSEPNYPIIISTEYFNTAEAQEKYFRLNLVKMIQVLKEDMSKFLKEIKGNRKKQLEKCNTSLNKSREKERQLKKINKTLQDAEMEIKTVKKTETE